MSAALRRCGDGWCWWCPGCGHGHRIGDTWGWTFNGDVARPTFSPSVLNKRTVWRGDATKGETPEAAPDVCHLFVREGRLEFLGDCTHALAGQTVDMVPFPDGYGGLDP